jgi:hypothetical protein
MQIICFIWLWYFGSSVLKKNTSCEDLEMKLWGEYLDLIEEKQQNQLRNAEHFNCYMVAGLASVKNWNTNQFISKRFETPLRN